MLGMTDSAYVGANVRHAYPGISDRPAPGPIQGPQPADRVLNSDLTARDVSVEFFGLLNGLLQPSCPHQLEYLSRPNSPRHSQTL